MQLIEALANAFINTFGITQPTYETRRKMAWFILGLLVLTLFLVVLAGITLYHLMNR